MKAAEIGKMARINIEVCHDMEFDEKDYLRVIQLKKKNIRREMEKFRIVNNGMDSKRFWDFYEVDKRKSIMQKELRKTVGKQNLKPEE